MGSPREKTEGMSQEQLDRRSRGMNEEHQEGQDNIKNRTRQMDPSTETYRKSRGGQ